MNARIEARCDLPQHYHQDPTFRCAPVCLGRVQREFLFHLGGVAKNIPAQLAVAARNAGVKKGLDTLGALRSWSKKKRNRLVPSLRAEIDKYEYTLLVFERRPEHTQPAVEHLVSRQLADGVGDRHFVPEGIFFWRELKHFLACVCDGQKQNPFTVALRRQRDTVDSSALGVSWLNFCALLYRNVLTRRWRLVFFGAFVRLHGINATESHQHCDQPKDSRAFHIQVCAKALTSTRNRDSVIASAAWQPQFASDWIFRVLNVLTNGRIIQIQEFVPMSKKYKQLARTLGNPWR